jgi:putative transposase
VFTKEEKAKALELYASTHSVKKTMIQLGYPSKSTLFKWLKERNTEPKSKRTYHLPDRPSRQAPLELKWTTLKRCFEAGEDVSKVAKEIGFHRVTVYNWRKKYVEEGSVGLMDSKKIPRQPLEEDTSDPASSDDIQELKKQVRRLQFELDVMKEIVHVIKKGLGVNPNPLSNKEKTVVVDALKDRYSQSQLLNYTAFPRSSYYYGLAKQQQADKYETLREMIQRIFLENHCAYGYRRIWAELRKRGCIVSEKVVRRLMADEGLQIAWQKKRHYRSYQGEVSPAVDNLLERDFQADKPNEKWLTDITEFHIPAGKVYLSPIIDCFDGLVVSWALSTTPDAALANRSLKQAIETLKDETPIVHSDRGGHYRWPDWIRLMDSHHLIRSMSKKGCSPDNAACEGFFGRLKNECFYHAKFALHTTAAFMTYIDEYIQWYNQKRIKQSLDYLSPVEYRQQIGAA